MPKGSKKGDKNTAAASLTQLPTEETRCWLWAHSPKACSLGALGSPHLITGASSVQLQQDFSEQLFPALVGTWLSLPIAVHAPPTSTRRDLPCVPNPKEDHLAPGA